MSSGISSTEHKHSLQGKLAIVTDASRGIGAAIAVGLASKGACVVVNYAQSKDEADEVVKMCKEKGGNAVAVQADVGDVKQCKKLIDECLNLCGEAHKHIDILINNAGIAAYQPVSEGDEATLDKVFATEVKGPFFLAKYAMQASPSTPCPRVPWSPNCTAWTTTRRRPRGAQRPAPWEESASRMTSATWWCGCALTRQSESPGRISTSMGGL